MRITPILFVFLTFLSSASAESFLGQLKNTFKLGFDSNNDRMGYYVGMSIGQSNWESSVQFTPGVSVDEDDTVAKLFVGVPLNETYAIEFGYSETAASVSAPNGALLQAANGVSFLTTSAGTADLDFESFSIGLRGKWLLLENLSGTGKLGIHRWESDINFGGMGGPSVGDSGMNVSLGLGLDYYWNDFITFRADLERVLEEEEVDLMMIGGALHF